MKHFKSEGVLLIEILVVIGILAILTGIGLPIGFNIYRQYILSSEQKLFLSVLRRAESLAMANSYQSGFGVAIQPGQLVIFKGSAFTDRDASFDEVYLRSASVNATGTMEIAFAQISGSPVAPASITLSSASQSKTIIINAHGMISW